MRLGVNGPFPAIIAEIKTMLKVYLLYETKNCLYMLKINVKDATFRVFFCLTLCDSLFRFYRK